MPAEISGFFDPETATVSYVLADPASSRAAIIDSVFDYDNASGRTDRRSADRVLDHVRDHQLTVDWILETHVHADHLSAAPLLRAELGAPVGIGSHVWDVQRVMAPIFGGEPPTRQPFDVLFDDEARFLVGTLEVRVLHTPGHTPACCTYVAGDAAFVGDTLFMPDFGTARCDFPAGDAHAMFRSIRRILDLPPETRILVGHDYPGDRRPVAWESTVAEQRALNKHVHDGIDEDAFVAMRTARDKTLKLPTLILPAVQCNIRAGQLPEADAHGRRYMRIPLDTL